MNEDAWNQIRSYDQCMQLKQPQECEELHPIETSYLMKLVHMDFVTIKFDEA